MKRIRNEQPKSSTGNSITFVKNSDGTAKAVIVSPKDEMLIKYFKSFNSYSLPNEKV